MSASDEQVEVILACSKCVCDSFHGGQWRPLQCGNCYCKKADHTRDPSVPFKDPKVEEEEAAAATAEEEEKKKKKAEEEASKEVKDEGDGEGQGDSEETDKEEKKEEEKKEEKEEEDNNNDKEEKEEKEEKGDKEESGDEDGDKAEGSAEGDTPAEGEEEAKEETETPASGTDDKESKGDTLDDIDAEQVEEVGDDDDEDEGDTTKAAEEPEEVDPEAQAKAEKKKQQRAETRVKILAEVLSSEEVYLTKLKAIIDWYIRPLEFLCKRDPIIEAQKIRTIFSNVEMLAKLNEDLRDNLQARGADESLGQIFIDIAPMLKMYIPYVNNFDNSLTAISEANKSDKFTSFCNEAQAKEACGGLNVSSLLIMPVQRIPRYELLLRDLIKNTEPDHADYTCLQDALTKIQEIAQIVNTKKTEQENMRKVLEIQNQFAPKPAFENLVKPHRRFIRHDKLTKKPTTHAGMDRRRHFFLFNDQIVYAKRNKSTDKYEYKGAIPLQFSQIRSIGDEKDIANLFEIYSMNTKTRFVIYAPEPHIKEAWLKDVNEAIQILNEQVMQKELSRTKSHASVRSISSVEKEPETTRDTVA